MQDTQPYKNHIRNLLKTNGRTRLWVSAQMSIPRATFWYKVNHDSFTAEEKSKIENTIINGTNALSNTVKN